MESGMKAERREGRRERGGETPQPAPHSLLGHFTLIQFPLGPSSCGQTLQARACSQAISGYTPRLSISQF